MVLRLGVLACVKYRYIDLIKLSQEDLRRAFWPRFLSTLFHKIHARV